MSYEGKGRVNKKEAIALYNGGLQVKEIAEKYEVRPSAISNMIARYKAEQDTLAEYRNNKASIMEHIQGKLLSSVSEEDPKSAQQLVTSAAILEDKIRLERGQSTVNTAVDIRMLIASLPNSTHDNTDSC